MTLLPSEHTIHTILTDRSFPAALSQQQSIHAQEELTGTGLRAKCLTSQTVASHHPHPVLFEKLLKDQKLSCVLLEKSFSRILSRKRYRESLTCCVPAGL